MYVEASFSYCCSARKSFNLPPTSSPYTNPPLCTINYATNPDWHEEDVLNLTDGAGVDPYVIENGGTSSLAKSLKCTRRDATRRHY
ncbi:hypothetical protein BDV95DRAFT_588194 [Massariosphaeria phaeospora]|uniref:Uncharacterized protein n=1 Tax=Massariosphaeria phaeospora TaxID=100035 RepID=A0A7C8M1P8_9PLEO|nr:hypothetical protein BDV95DRAFT_588194 [Massariosphaeria phaeospora]